MRKRVLTLLSVLTLGAVIWSGGVPTPSTWKTPKFFNWGWFWWGVTAENNGGFSADVTYIRASNLKEKEAFGQFDISGKSLIAASETKFGNWFVRVNIGRSQYRRIEWAEGKWAKGFLVSSTTAPGPGGGPQ